MFGIIYKFTIVAKYKMSGNKPFYVGQYSGKKFDLYWGSGSIWQDFLKRIKGDLPSCWKKFIKREILYQGNCTQSALDKLEEIYIRREHALYSEGLGGCNILPGTANKFGSGSPMKDPDVVRKCSESTKRYFEKHPEVVKIIQDKRIWKLNNSDYKEKISNSLRGRYVGKNNPNFGNRWTSEQKENLSKKMKGRYVGKNNPNFGHHWTKEQREKMSERLRSKVRVNPMTGKVRITNGKINTIIPKESPLPEGFWYGMKPRKK